jgi:hypothetical protein
MTAQILHPKTRLRKQQMRVRDLPRGGFSLSTPIGVEGGGGEQLPVTRDGGGGARRQRDVTKAHVVLPPKMGMYRTPTTFTCGDRDEVRFRHPEDTESDAPVQL